MNIQEVLSDKVKEAVQSIFDKQLPNVEFQPTRKDFEGDITIVVFPMLRVVKGNPVQIGEQIGAYLEEHVDAVAGFNVIKGFSILFVSRASCAFFSMLSRTCCSSFSKLVTVAVDLFLIMTLISFSSKEGLMTSRDLSRTL